MRKLSFENMTKIIVTVKILTILFIIVAANIAAENVYIEGESFYKVLRIVVSTVSAVSIFLSTNRNDTKGIIIFTALTVIFNPIVPFYTLKGVWVFIDIVAIVAFIYAIINDFSYINDPENRASLIKSDAGLPQSSRDLYYAQKYLDLGIKIERDAGNTTLYGDERLKTALILYRNAIKCDPNLIKAYINIGNIILKLPHFSSTYLDQGIEELNRATKLFPEKSELYKLRGMILLLKSRRTIVGISKSKADFITDALYDLSEYLRSNPDDQHINELKGVSYYELEKIDPVGAQSLLILELGSQKKGAWMDYYTREKLKHYPHLHKKKNTGANLSDINVIF